MNEENNSKIDAENGLMEDSNKENVKIKGLDDGTGSKKTTSASKKQIKKYYNKNCVLICVIINLVIAIICFIMGAVYAKDCPNAPGIPVVLIIYGLLMLLGFVWERVKPMINQNSDLIKRIVLIVTNVFYLLKSVIFITWIVVVYSSPTVEFEDSEAENYCNRNVYLLALYLINTYLITLAVCLGGLFLLKIYMKKE